MPRMTPAEFADKLIRRQTASLDDMVRGIDRVSEPPGRKAVQKQAKMKANLIASIDNGKWAKNLGSVTLEEWKTKMKDIGVGRVQAGVEASRAKLELFGSKFLPFLDTVLARVNAMPDSTLEERIAKSNAYMREAAKFSFTR